jgi:hypothetical protein
MTPAQCRAGRADQYVDLEACLARSVVDATKALNYESGIGLTATADIATMQTVLEIAGVEFIDGDRPGVRMAKGGK